MNPAKICGWLIPFSFLALGHFCLASPAPTVALTAIPAPCSLSLSVFNGTNASQSPISTVPATADLFGACDARQVNQTHSIIIPTEGVGFVPQSMDLLIKGIVEDRIQNLYLGFDGLTSPISKTDSKWIKDYNLIRSTTGFGSCANTGACNQFCGEGGLVPPGATGPHIIATPFPSNVTLDLARLGLTSANSQNAPSASGPSILIPQAGYGFAPNQGRANLYNGLTGRYVAENGLQVKLSDFYAYGVFETFNGNGGPGAAMVPAATIPAGTSPAPNSIDPEGWPLQGIQNSSTAGKICNSGAPIDQPDLSTHTAHCFADAQHYHLKTLTWDDGTYPRSLPAGSGSTCDYQFTADYSNATTIASLENGAMVQATWNALNNVYNEISVPPYKLNLTNPQCQTLATSYLTDIRNLATSIANLLPPSDLSRNGLLNIMNKCIDPRSAGFDQPGQINCHYKAALDFIHNRDFVSIAQCEVMARAQSQFDFAFTSPNGAAWINQLKSWATTSCMAASGDLFTGEQHSAVCLAAAVAGWCPFSFFLCPIVTAIASGVIYCPSNTDACMMAAGSCSSNIQTDLQSAYLGSGSTKMGNCFPYAYSVALQSYLRQLGFSPPVNSIQFQYSSPQPAPSGGPALSAHLIDISGCQIIDNTPGFAPRTKPIFP